MQRQTAAGIWGLGAYLPPTVRTNDWWSKEVVESWRHMKPDLLPSGVQEGPVTNPGQQVVLDALKEYEDDPFKGTVERRVLDDNLDASFMELKAAQAALENAGIEAGAIDAVLGFSFVPDYQMSPNPCAIHRDLGLRKDCMVMAVDASCDSFLYQLALAEGLIAAGRARYVLIFQSSLLRRVVPDKGPSAAWFGDAATAAVIGPVDGALGIQAVSHRCDGTFHDALVMSVPGGRWYDEGLPVFHPRIPQMADSIIVSAADCAKDVVDQTLSDVNIAHDSINFYTCHQPTPWFRPLTQKFVGLENAAFVDCHPWAAHIGSCSIPLSLMIANQEGKLKRGDWVATYSGGVGITWSSVLLRWGR